mmetsp:Transcript_26885/g.36261  ORF Transcript_26885/g.36261 Transcript_26885/m.36261 type:complete len:290 (-) Transcript_26885:22-891(-)
MAALQILAATMWGPYGQETRGSTGTRTDGRWSAYLGHRVWLGCSACSSRGLSCATAAASTEARQSRGAHCLSRAGRRASCRLSGSTPHLVRIDVCDQLLKIEILGLGVWRVLPAGRRLNESCGRGTQLLERAILLLQPLVEEVEQCRVREGVAVLLQQIVSAGEEVLLQYRLELAARIWRHPHVEDLGDVVRHLGILVAQEVLRGCDAAIAEGELLPIHNDGGVVCRCHWHSTQRRHGQLHLVLGTRPARKHTRSTAALVCAGRLSLCGLRIIPAHRTAPVKKGLRACL